MLPLNFNHLYYFYVVATHGSFSRAAEELRISQSSISVQIKQFESSVDRRLFDRVKSGVELTDSGQVVFQYAERVFREVGELTARLEEMDQRITGSIKVGTVNSIGIYMLPAFLGDFNADHAEVKIGIEFESPRELSNRLLAGRLDFAILPSNRKYDGLTATMLTKNKLFLLAPPDHPLAHKGRVVPSDLERYPFLGYEEGMEIRGMMDGLFRRMSLAIEYAMESSNVATLKHMVMAGVGLGLLPETAVGEEIRRGQLVRLQIPSLYLAQEITIYYKTNRTLNPARTEFLKRARAHFAPKHPKRAKRA
jgi:DNA-binding transcriptional LysR family regulator